VRKRNEASLVESLTGVLVRIENSRLQNDSAVMTHNTETELRNAPVDAVLVNDGTLDDLRVKVFTLLDTVTLQLTGGNPVGGNPTLDETNPVPNATYPVLDETNSPPSVELPSTGLPSARPSPSAGLTGVNPDAVISPTLDDIVLATIREREPDVTAQAKNPANRFEHFMEGRLMGAVSNAMMDVLNNPDIPQSLRDEARQIFQGPQGMTDYRAHIGRMVFDGERAGQSATYSAPEDPPGTEVITPSRETDLVTDPLLDGYVIAHVRKHGTPELLDQLNARAASNALQAAALPGAALPGLVAAALVSARNDINLSFGLHNLASEIARSDSSIIDYAKVIGSMAANVPHVENTRNPTPALPAESPMDATLDAPHHPIIMLDSVTELDGVNQSAQGAFDGFSAGHHQLLLKQEDGNILAVQHPNIDDWRTTGMFNGKGGWAGDRDEAKAIEDLQANHSTVSIRTATNQGDGRGPVPIVLLAVNGEQRSISFVSHLAKIQKHQRERAAAFDALVTHYAGNDRVLISLPNPLTDQQGDKTMTVTYVLGQHDCQIEVTFKDIDANSGIFSKRTARALLLENGKDTHWSDAAEANIRDPQQLIRDLEGLRDAAMAEITLRTIQEPLIQAYIDSYITAADRIEATLKAVIRDAVQDQASAAFAYHAVDEVIREVQHNVIAPAADALRAVSTNQQISIAVNERLSHDTRAQRHSQALRDARDLHDHLFALAKTRTAERGKAALTGNNENTPIEDVAVAIFNKHGIETPVTPKIVSLVQNRDVDGVQSAIGYNSMNPASQEVFEHMTGIKLAKTQKKRVEQIDAWAGITPEQRQAMESEKSAQRQAREANRELERTWESLKHMNMRGGDNGQDFVLAIVKEGHTRATSYKKGASTQYGLLNSETQSTRFIQKNRDFNDFCKAIVMMDPNGDVLVALQKAGLVNAPQLDAEQPAVEVSPEVAGLAAAQEQIRLEEKADLVKRSALSAAEAESEAETAIVPGATLPDAIVPDDAELSDMDDDDEAMDDEIEDGDYSPVPESEKSPLPVMKMAGPDMLSPLWDMK
ncbi:hypothetical protein HAP94_22205, partial [Acidithiobacillus ferrivorans]|nr:hypothetical protein [Acidithiobacillus ferrivorans]